MRSSIISKVSAGLIAAVLAVAASAPAAHAQDGGFAAKVKIPFAFQIASGQHFTPGVYTLRMNGHHFIDIRSSTESGTVLTQLTSVGLPANDGKAVFTRYGDQYYLRSVWVAGNSSHLLFQISKAERESQRATVKPAGTVELALLKAGQ